MITDGTIYTTNFDPSNDGSAIALNAQDGNEQWRTTLSGQGDHGKALVNGRFILAHSTELVALDQQNGNIIWRRPLKEAQTSGGSRYSPELLAADEQSGTIVVPYQDGLKAFRVEDGESYWETTKISRQELTPAIHDETVYALGRIDGTNSLAAFDLDNGTTRWTTALEDPSTSADPVVTDRGVLIVDGNTLAIHDQETGERRGEIDVFETTETMSTTVATDGETAFVANDERLLMVNIAAGTTQTLHNGRVYSEGFCVGRETVVAIVDGSEYISSDSHDTITAFDRETGDVRWNYVLDGFHSLTIPPILADGAVFFGTSSIDALAVLGDVPAEE